jgi:hypothetical protein
VNLKTTARERPASPAPISPGLVNGGPDGGAAQQAHGHAAEFEDAMDKRS